MRLEHRTPNVSAKQVIFRTKWSYNVPWLANYCSNIESQSIIGEFDSHWEIQISLDIKKKKKFPVEILTFIWKHYVAAATGEKCAFTQPLVRLTDIESRIIPEISIIFKGIDYWFILKHTEFLCLFKQTIKQTKQP